MEITSSTSKPDVATTNSKENTTGKTDELNLGKDDFLRLFMESLKHQDPMSPMETKDMMAQMSQLGMMEGITNLSKTAEKMEKSLIGNQMAQASSLLGRTVVAENSKGEAVVGSPTAYRLNEGIVEYLIENQVIKIGSIKEVGLTAETEKTTGDEKRSGDDSVIPAKNDSGVSA